MQQRFLTWNKVPSEVQVECLRSALDGSKEPLSVCFFFFFFLPSHLFPVFEGWAFSFSFVLYTYRFRHICRTIFFFSGLLLVV